MYGIRAAQGRYTTDREHNMFTIHLLRTGLYVAFWGCFVRRAIKKWRRFALICVGLTRFGPICVDLPWMDVDLGGPASQVSFIYIFTCARHIRYRFFKRRAQKMDHIGSWTTIFSCCDWWHSSFFWGDSHFFLEHPGVKNLKKNQRNRPPKSTSIFPNPRPFNANQRKSTRLDFLFFFLEI